MAEHQRPKKEPRLPEDEREIRREAGDRPVPTPDHLGNLPEDSPGPGRPVAFPGKNPED